MSDIIAEEKEKEESNSKMNCRFLVLILLSVVLLVSGVIGLSFVLPKNISGAWALVVNPEVAAATSDEIPKEDMAYYVFAKPDRYGRGEYYTCYQGGVEYYEYELMEEDGVKKINLGTENMEYKITGSKLFGSAKLTIIYPEYKDENTGAVYEAEEYVFEQAKNPRYEKSSFTDFEIDKALINQWTSNERTLAYYYYYFPYAQTIEFTDEGVMSIRYESADLGLDRYMYYAYTAKDSELTFSLVTDKETKYTVSYEFDENGNLKFINDTTTGSIFADAFFGNFTFYTAENLPEPTEASVDELYFTE
ncbi:MAG: hypothetical protein IJD93_03425 [Ruminococcus sp.]|nr:hypothetical protein [Ruminococcus sp.]